MAIDPVTKAAIAAVDLDDQIEKQLTRHGGPVGYLLIEQRRMAMAAATDLMERIEPSDAIGIIRCRLRIQMYRELVDGLTQAIEEGRRAWTELDEADREAFAEILVQRHQYEETD